MEILLSKSVVEKLNHRLYNNPKRYMPYNITGVKLKMSEDLESNKKQCDVSNNVQKNTRPKAKDLEKLSKALKANMMRRKSKKATV